MKSVTEVESHTIPGESEYQNSGGSFFILKEHRDCDLSTQNKVKDAGLQVSVREGNGQNQLSIMVDLQVFLPPEEENKYLSVFLDSSVTQILAEKET